MAHLALVVGEAEAGEAVDGYYIDSLQSQQDAGKGAVEAARVHEQAADLAPVFVEARGDATLQVFAESFVNSYGVAHLQPRYHR